MKKDSRALLEESMESMAAEHGRMLESITTLRGLIRVQANWLIDHDARLSRLEYMTATKGKKKSG